MSQCHVTKRNLLQAPLHPASPDRNAFFSLAFSAWGRFNYNSNLLLIKLTHFKFPVFMLTRKRGGLEAQKNQFETHPPSLALFSIMNAYITMLLTTEKINLPCILQLHSDREQGRVRSSKNSVWNTYSPLSLSLFPAYITMLPTTEKINLPSSTSFWQGGGGEEGKSWWGWGGEGGREKREESGEKLGIISS